MYEELVKRLRDISNNNDGIKSNYIGMTMLQAADAIEELSEQINERKTTPPETGEPTVYELQILANQVTIMGALAVIFPEKGDQEILQNMLQGAKNTRKLVVSVMMKEDAWLK